MASHRETCHWLALASMAALVVGCPGINCDGVADFNILLHFTGQGRVDFPDAQQLTAASDGATAHQSGSDQACPERACLIPWTASTQVRLVPVPAEGWRLGSLTCRDRCTREGSTFRCDFGLGSFDEAINGVNTYVCEVVFSPAPRPLGVRASAVAQDGPAFFSLVGSADGGTPPYAFAWDGGPGVIIGHLDHSRPNASANASGVHGTVTFTLTATDAESTQASATASVTLP